MLTHCSNARCTHTAPAAPHVSVILQSSHHLVTADVLIGAAGDMGNTALHAVFGCIVPCWLSHLDHIWQLSCFVLLYAGKKRSERARKERMMPDSPDLLRKSKKSTEERDNAPVGACITSHHPVYGCSPGSHREHGGKVQIHEAGLPRSGREVPRHRPRRRVLTPWARQGAQTCS